MRDWIVLSIVFGSLPFIVARPYVGALMWAWISVMNPHRLTFGIAYDFPVAMVIAAATLVGLSLRLWRLRFPWYAPSALLLAFTAWMGVTTLFALVPDAAQAHWRTVMSMLLMAFVTMVALEEKRHVELLVWVLALSVAFFGVKGGVFTIMGGAEDRVFGPMQSNLADNNDLALALVMALPLLLYLLARVTGRAARWALAAVAGLTVVAVLGCYSRGGFLALAAVGFFLWWRSRHKWRLAALALAVASLSLAVLPDKWFDRMGTITSSELDRSSLGRLNAWQMSWNIAVDRPLVGGGFMIQKPQVYQRYAPDPSIVLAPHSIYFAALGEHGFVGLLLVLALGVACWRTASSIERDATGLAELKWAADLARAIQASLFAFAAGGAFLSLLYFDLPYYLVAILVVLRQLVARAAPRAAPAAQGAAA